MGFKEAPKFTKTEDRFASLNKGVFDYFKGVGRASEFPILHPAIDTVKVFGDHAKDDSIAYCAVRLNYRASVGDSSEKPSHMLYIFNDDGSAYTYPSLDIQKSRRGFAEGLKPDGDAYGFLMTVLTSLSEGYPDRFSNPANLRSELADIVFALAS